MGEADADYTGGTTKADHLCVLVHGLWGNPNHMASCAKALRAQFTADQLYLLVAKSNSGTFTYDGIECGGERVCTEIEEELAATKRKGGNITKISIVGYSLGGLVARYAIGLLSVRGVLDGLECMNFTAFASPFLGVRSPVRGWFGRLFNVLGARTLCASGRQLFGVDSFRDTGRPLLAVLADPNSIFMAGLARFKRRTLYANVVNDRTAVFYTTSISKTDPFADISKVRANFVEGYEDVVLDPIRPVDTSGTPPPLVAEPGLIKKWTRRAPWILALSLLIPVGFAVFMVNAAVQTVRSSRRVRLHESGGAGIDTKSLRVNLWIREVQEAVEDAFEHLNSAQQPEYLVGQSSSSSSSDNEESAENKKVMARERRESNAAEPTLALAPYQFAAARNLNALGWNKYPVWIRKVRHSHAAIVVRVDRPSFEEGKVILRHWANEEFLV